jgi:O-acetyl-ADP-ribose deacetylase (regulator of RNase III)
MLHVTSGDLFSGIDENSIIVHGCNGQSVMGSGFAKEVRSRYPDAYAVYMRAPSMLGSVSYANSLEGPVIANAITQEFYGRDKSVRYVSYDAVVEAMEKVKKYHSTRQHLNIHFPLIGGGLANGNHNILLSIYMAAFKTVDATLWLNSPDESIV